MFRRLFLVFLVFLGMGPRVWAEGIIPVICATQQFKSCKNIDTIFEYLWREYLYEESGSPDKVYVVKNNTIFEYLWREYLYEESGRPDKVYVLKKFNK